MDGPATPLPISLAIKSLCTLPLGSGVFKSHTGSGASLFGIGVGFGVERGGGGTILRPVAARHA